MRSSIDIAAKTIDIFRKSARPIVRETKVRYTESSEALPSEDGNEGAIFFSIDPWREREERAGTETRD